MYNKKRFYNYKNDIIFFNYKDIKNNLYNINFKGLDKYFNLKIDRIDSFIILVD